MQFPHAWPHPPCKPLNQYRIPIINASLPCIGAHSLLHTIQLANPPMGPNNKRQRQRIPVAVGVSSLMQRRIRMNSLPVPPIVNRNIRPIRPNRDPGLSSLIVSHSRPIPMRRTLCDGPMFATIARVGSRSLRIIRLQVITADNYEAIVVTRLDGKGTAGLRTVSQGQTYCMKSRSIINVIAKEEASAGRSSRYKTNCIALIHQQHRIACRKCAFLRQRAQTLPSCSLPIRALPVALPRRAFVVCCPKAKTTAHGIADQIAILVETVEKNRIPKPILIWIRKHELPCLASIRSLIQPRQIARSARHHNCRIRVERLNAAKIQLFSTRRNRARLPKITAILSSQHRSIRPAGPGNASANVVDAAQISRSPRVQNLPLRICCTAANQHQRQPQSMPLHSQQFRPGIERRDKRIETVPADSKPAVPVAATVRFPSSPVPSLPRSLAPSLPCSLAPSVPAFSLPLNFPYRQNVNLCIPNLRPLRIRR
jgi:hypothetical protein